MSFAEGQGAGEVLCLTPLSLPAGHSCLVAEAYHPWLDPVAATAAFNVPTDRHVAQRNLTLVTARNGMFRLTFDIHNPDRLPQALTVDAVTGPIDILRAGWEQFFTEPVEMRDGAIRDLGLSREAVPDAAARPSKRLEGVKLTAGGRLRFAVAGRLDGEMAIAHIRVHRDGVVVGGLSVLVVQKGVF